MNIRVRIWIEYVEKCNCPLFIHAEIVKNIHHIDMMNVPIKRGGNWANFLLDKKGNFDWKKNYSKKKVSREKKFAQQFFFFTQTLCREKGRDKKIARNSPKMWKYWNFCPSKNAGILKMLIAWLITLAHIMLTLEIVTFDPIIPL